MKFHTLWILLLAIGISFQGICQQKRLDLADENFNKYAYIDAREIYLKVAEKGYKSFDLFKKLGDSYYFNGDLKGAVKWYGELFDNYEKDMDPEYLFRYSQCLKGIKNYEEADTIMLLFEKKGRKDERRAELFERKRNYLKLIGLQSGKYKLNYPKINSENSDFAPSFYKNQLVFASSRKDKMNETIHVWNDMPFLDIYQIDISKDTISKTKAKPIKGKINTKYHESSTCFTKDGEVMYFTRNNFTDYKLKIGKGGTILLKLYKSEFKNGKWEEAEELPFNDDNYSVAHPTLNADDSKLYFSSDMPGTIGNSDIYVVDIDANGGFGKPRNLGPEINTEGRETFPFISEKGDLYFSSDGHVGLGGLDVYIAENKIGGFGTPFNVGEPINSSSDDFAFILNEENRTGYFSSNRSGGAGDDDIYGFLQIGDLITSCKQYVNGTITDRLSKEEIMDATVILSDMDNNEIERTISVDGSYRFVIECDKRYLITVKHPNYKSKEKFLYQSKIFEKKHFLDFELERGNELGMRMARTGDDLFKLLQLNSIYFDTNKSVIRSDAETELQKIITLLQQYPSMKIDVRSHTDSRANDKYNMKLSNRRAESTIAYIIEKGKIATDRLTAKGYGESQLVNDCRNGVPCSDNEHELNRRSEFIILN